MTDDTLTAPKAFEIYTQIKDSIHHYTLFSKDLLHVYGGVAVFLCLGYLFKNKRLGSVVLIIGFMAVINEVIDLVQYHKITGNYYWTESLKDIFNTMLIPTLLYFYFRSIRKR